MRALAILVLAASLCAGCGLSVQSSDLFLLTRTGQGTKLSVLVNDSGTIACNGEKPQPLPDPLLLQARDLATALDKDARAAVRIPQGRRSVYRFTLRLEHGTIAFPDTASARHAELAQPEQFALQVAQSVCKPVPS